MGFGVKMGAAAECRAHAAPLELGCVKGCGTINMALRRSFGVEAFHGRVFGFMGELIGVCLAAARSESGTSK